MFRNLPRYDHYAPNNSPWLGELPLHWRTQRTKSLLAERSQKGYPDQPLLAATQSQGVILKSDYGTRTVAATKDLHLLKLVEVGDFVISLRSFQGGIERCYHRGIISPAYTVLTAKHGGYREYLTYLFKMRPFVDSLTLSVTGIREGQNIDYPTLAVDRLPVPPPEEQAAIVKYLAHANARIDKAIVAKRRLIALLEEQRSSAQSIVLENTSGVRARLKNFATLQTGLTLGKDYRQQELTEYPYLRVENVQMGHIDATEIAKVLVPTREAEKFSLRPGDVLMTEGGDIDKLGRGTVWDGHISPCLHQNHIFAVRCGKKLRPDFLAAWLAASIAREYFYMTAKKTTNLASTNSTTVGRLPILVPSLGEQAQTLRAISTETAPMLLAINKTQREITLLREFRTRLVADVVTGQVDVRAIAAGLPDAPEAVADSADESTDELAEITEGDDA